MPNEAARARPAALLLLALGACTGERPPVAPAARPSPTTAPPSAPDPTCADLEASLDRWKLREVRADVQRDAEARALADLLRTVAGEARQRAARAIPTDASRAAADLAAAADEAARAFQGFADDWGRLVQLTEAAQSREDRAVELLSSLKPACDGPRKPSECPALEAVTDLRDADFAELVGPLDDALRTLQASPSADARRRATLQDLVRALREWRDAVAVVLPVDQSFRGGRGRLEEVLKPLMSGESALRAACRGAH